MSVLGRFIQVAFISAGFGLIGVALWFARPDGLSPFSSLGADETRAPTYNLIVISVESWRRDAATPDLLPKLHAALDSHDGVMMPNHNAVSAWTVPNVVALLTGTHPISQGILSRDQSIQTAPANGGHLWPGFSLSNSQPFTLIRSYDGLGLVRDASVPFEAAVAALRLYDGPAGIWHHYLGTHLPYSPILEDGTRIDPDDPAFETVFGLPPPSGAGEAERRQIVATQPVVPATQVTFDARDRVWIDAFYQSQIKAFDRWFGDFFDTFVRLGLHRDTVLVVTADHGEELGEDGRVGHASTTQNGVLTDEITAIPLMIWTPDETDRRDLEDWRGAGLATDHVDLGLSLPGLIGLPAPTTVWTGVPQGEDSALARVLSGRDLTDAPIEKPLVSFTSAAGFAEKNPFRSDYYLIAVRNSAGVNCMARFSHEELLEPGQQVFPDCAETLISKAAAGIVWPLLPNQQTMRVGGGATITPIWPTGSGTLNYDTISVREAIEWEGDPNAAYFLEYRAGEGPMAIEGRIEVEGTRYVFGDLDRDYWTTYIVPYNHVRVRIQSSDGARSSEWFVFTIEP